MKNNNSHNETDGRINELFNDDDDVCRCFNRNNCIQDENELYLVLRAIKLFLNLDFVNFGELLLSLVIKKL